MWNAVIASKAPTGIQDLYGLPVRGRDENRKNFEHIVVPLLKYAADEVILPYELDGNWAHQRARIGLVAADQFLKFFENLYWHPEYTDNIKALTGFIKRATNEKRIADWAVVWTWPQTEGRLINIPELGGDVPIVRRKRRGGGRIDFIGSDRKHRAAAIPITLGRSVGSLGESSTRGVVLVSLVPDRDPDDLSIPVKRDELVGLLSIAAPVKATPRSSLVQWTVINSAKPDDVVVELST
jgi:hypothetical protein